MQLQEIEIEIRVLRLQILSASLKSKRAKKKIYDRYFYLRLLHIDELIRQNNSKLAADIVKEMILNLPNECKEKKDMNKKKKPFLQSNDRFGQLLRGTE